MFELDETYSCREIDKSTVFVAIAGFGDSQTITTRILNAAFSRSGPMCGACRSSWAM